ncbi:MAG: hypothetical protein LC747_02825 [Acidobacteria bacterium]|nr:hypothetical protein [Acidobacteriota bacterium]
MTANPLNEHDGDGRSCPRCAATRLRTWSELDEAEREIVRRLPASVDYTLQERAARHLWCGRCWHEELGGAPREA